MLPLFPRGTVNDHFSHALECLDAAVQREPMQMTTVHRTTDGDRMGAASVYRESLVNSMLMDLLKGLLTIL